MTDNDDLLSAVTEALARLNACGCHGPGALVTERCAACLIDAFSVINRAGELVERCRKAEAGTEYDESVIKGLQDDAAALRLRAKTAEARVTHAYARVDAAESARCANFDAIQADNATLRAQLAEAADAVVAFGGKCTELGIERNELRAQLSTANTCAHCGCTLLSDGGLPHCFDCIVTEEDEERAALEAQPEGKEKS